MVQYSKEHTGLNQVSVRVEKKEYNRKNLLWGKGML